MKLEQVIEEMQRTWGGLPIRDMNYAVNIFDHALKAVFSAPYQEHMGRTVAGLMIQALRERGMKSGGHAAITDLTSILQDHIDKGTTLYVFTGYWAHHSPPDSCQGEDSDYCEHHVFEEATLHPSFADASHYAWESLHDRLIPGCPNSSTNARVKIDIFDGDHLIPVGEWQWDKLFSRLQWANPQRH